jgi:hypothetical protein
MLTYRYPARGLARVLLLLGMFVFALSAAPAIVAQERRYLFEAGAAGAYQSYGNTADLSGAPGGVARIGLWLPLNFSVEAEGSVASPTAQAANTDVNVKTGWAAVLYNILVGTRNSAYSKFGVGGTK